MKLTIEGTPKEIAELVLAVQERQEPVLDVDSVLSDVSARLADVAQSSVSKTLDNTL